MKKSIFLALTVFCLSNIVFSQNSTYSAGMKVPEEGIRSYEETTAALEFRLGIQAYYKGSYNEAIRQFEIALSNLPNDSLILEWLGNAYYKAGMEGTALSYWQSAVNNGYGGLLLQNKIEIVRERRVTGDFEEKYMKLTETGNFEGNFNGNLVFSGPVSILPNMDGTLWVSAYNSNKLFLMNLNGKVLDTITGPLNGFDRPLDIVRFDGDKILVAESAGDRICVLDSKAHFIKYIGSKGRALGNMVGPQYIAVDSFDRIYVTDYGNRRVDVFDKDGTPLFFFGGKQMGFGGLKGPTGIAVIGDSVYVADEYTGCIYEFDRAGNFVSNLVQEKSFKKPEAIRKWQNSLIICDSNKIYNIDIGTGALFEFVTTGKGTTRITTAVPDVNNNILVADFKANEIYVMSKMQDLVGGLFVQVEQVDATSFPNITVQVKVENRHRQPVVGLQEENFYFTENKRPVSQLKFNGSAANNTYADITIMIDRSNSSSAYKTEIETAVKEIADSMEGRGTLRVISAGAMPVTEYVGNPAKLGNFSLAALKTPVSDDVRFDLAIRLAANDLINAAKKRSIIYISDGNINNATFEQYNLAELTSYLNNNSIDFSFIQVNQAAVANEYDYIINNTCGELYYVFRPEGLRGIYRDIIDIPKGIYQFSYVSSLPTNFGEKFLPLEVEIYLLNRSGRAECGYFSPLK